MKFFHFLYQFNLITILLNFYNLNIIGNILFFKYHIFNFITNSLLIINLYLIIKSIHLFKIIIDYLLIFS